MQFNLKTHENKREVVATLKARALDGSERTIEECRAFVRTREANGNWSEWTLTPPNQFWSDGIFCNRIGETEFVPLLTDEKLTLI